MSVENLPENETSHSELLKADDFFDKYRIVSFIGRGGMSEVYLAEHLLLKQHCALKIMKDPNGGKDSEIFQRFLREARCFYKLEHPNIVRIYDVGCDSKTGWLFIVMEYLDGVSLAEYGRQPLPAAELLRIAGDMAEALGELADKGVVHRDIKPSNIMRCKNGQYKLMDLGIAKAAGALLSDHTLTLGNSVFGTPAYASPEQCQNPHLADIRSDIYSLGVSLYHLACGKLPYNGQTPVETILNVVSGKPVPLEKVRKNLPRPVAELIKCMMNKVPEKRPQTAGELKELIRKTAVSPVNDRIINGKLRIVTYVVLLLIISGAAAYTYFAVKKQKERAAEVAGPVAAAEPPVECHAEDEAAAYAGKEPERIESSSSAKTAPPVAVRQCAFSPIDQTRINNMIRHWAEAHRDMENWQEAPWPGWQTHFGFAGIQAKEENKMLLIFFCDSRVLPDSFGDEESAAFIQENFVPVFINFHMNDMVQSQRKHIATIRNLFRNNRWPISVVVTSDGEHIATIPGFTNHLDPLYREILSELLAGNRVHFDSNNNYIRPSYAEQGNGEDL